MNRHQRRAAEAKATPQACAPEKLAQASVAADQAGQPGTAQLMREMRRGDIAVLFNTDRERPVSVEELSKAQLPTLVVIGDDDYRSTGPAGWRATPALAAWAEAAVVHASGASAETYAEAAKAARIKGRAVLVETDTAHARDWAEVFRDRPVLLVLPRDGAHPAVPPRSSVH